MASANVAHLGKPVCLDGRDDRHVQGEYYEEGAKDQESIADEHIAVDNEQLILVVGDACRVAAAVSSGGAVGVHLAGVGQGVRPDRDP